MSTESGLRVGLAIFSAGWFGDIGQNVDDAAAGRVVRLRGYLADRCELTAAGLISNVDAAGRAAAEFRNAGVDLVLLACPAWSEDEPAMRLAAELPDKPLWLVDTGGYRGIPDNVGDQAAFFATTELVGLFQMNSTLRRVRPDLVRLQFSPGESDHAHDLANALDAFQAVKRTRGANVGLCPSRSDALRCTAADEMAIARHLGARVRHVSMDRISSAFDAVDEREMETYLGRLGEIVPLEGVADGEALAQSARLSLAMAGAARDLALAAMAMDDLDVDLHARFGLRPAMFAREAIDDSPILTLEGDVSVALSLLLLENLGGGPGTILEPFYVIDAEGAVLFGHAGGCDPRLGDPDRLAVEPDLEYASSDDRYAGAPSIMVTGRPGSATVMAMRVEADGVNIVAMRGTVLPHERVLPGYSEFLVQLAPCPHRALDALFEHGCSQHTVICYGDLLGRLGGLVNVLDNVNIELLD